MGWFLCHHPLVTVNTVQESSRCIRLVLAVYRPARIRFQTVMMCSVSQSVAGRPHTSLEIDNARTARLRRNVLWFHDSYCVFLDLHTSMVQELLLQSTSRLLLS